MTVIIHTAYDCDYTLLMTVDMQTSCSNGDFPVC